MAMPLTPDLPYHGQLSVALICDQNVSDGAKTLYSYIWAYGYACNKPPTRDQMALDLHITPVTVTNRLRELVKQRWVAVWNAIVDGRIANNYEIFKLQRDCDQFHADNPSLPYIVFKHMDKVERKSRVGKGGRKRSDDSKSKLMINSGLPPAINPSIPDQETQVYHGSAHSLLSNTENKKIKTIQNKGDRASANTSPLQTEAAHVTDKVQMVKPEPRKELLYEPKAQPSKPESNAPPSVPAVSPVDAGPMIDALAAACMKFVKLPKHYKELKKTADSLIMLGFTADDVMQWRARCWPDHWKTKKGQPVPTLDDVLNNIGQVRTLTAATISTNAYLNDPYFAGRDDDDPPDAFTDEELPPRQLAQLDHTTARRWHQAVTQVSGRLSATEGKAFETDVNAIGMVGKNTIVIEIATEEKRKKFVNGYMPFLESEFNRFDGRSDDNVKPPISFALVIVGDEQYRDG